MKSFLLLRIGVFSFYIGIILGMYFESPHLMLYLGFSGALLALLFSWCPKCKQNILQYYAWNPLKQIEFMWKFVTFQELECPYCHDDESQEQKTSPPKPTKSK